MALIPLVFSDYLYNNSPRLSRLLDRQFVGDDLLTALTVPSVRNFRIRNIRCPNIDHKSTIKIDKDKFQTSLDVQQFSPEEITVKTVDDNCIVIEGKHEEREDEHGYVSRQFTRRVLLPRGHDIKQLSSKLSSDGVLTITAPKINARTGTERVIPITHTGPVKRKAVEDSESKESANEKANKKTKH